MPDQLIPMHLTLKEIAIISELRGFDFGIIEIHKAQNSIQRIVIRKQRLITDRDGIVAMKREHIAITDKTTTIR